MTSCNTTPKMMHYNSAKRRVLSSICAKSGVETCPLHDAEGRVVAHDIISPCQVPPHDNAAMDGYALGQPAIHSANPLRYPIVGKVLAGQVFEGPLNTGEAVRIMTGAMVPAGTHSVVMQEHVTLAHDVDNDGDNCDVVLDAPPTAQNNIRLAGEDIAQGQTVLLRGAKITPVDLGLLASLGIAQVDVRQKITVAIFATGNELQAQGKPLKVGQIYDSNSFVLCTALKRLGVKVIDYGIIEDSLAAIETCLLSASEEADVIITSGGVSVGEADFVKTALDKHGDVDFWKVAIKPGKPFAFGKVGNAEFFGLPGNPVSAAITFQQLVIPALEAKMGMTPQELPTFWAEVKERIRKRPGRMDFQRGVYSISRNGSVEVTALKGQGSGILSSLSNANCLLLLEEDQDDILPGEKIQISLFHPAMS